MEPPVRPSLAQVVAKAILRHPEAGKKATTLNPLAIQARVTVTAISRLKPTDDPAESARLLDPAENIATVLDGATEVRPETIEP